MTCPVNPGPGVPGRRAQVRVDGELYTIAIPPELDHLFEPKVNFYSISTGHEDEILPPPEACERRPVVEEVTGVVATEQPDGRFRFTRIDATIIGPRSIARPEALINKEDSMTDFPARNLDVLKAKTATGDPTSGVKTMSTEDIAAMHERLQTDGDFFDGEERPGWFGAEIREDGRLYLRYETAEEGESERQEYVLVYQLTPVIMAVGPKGWEKR